MLLACAATVGVKPWRAERVEEARLVAGRARALRLDPGLLRQLLQRHRGPAGEAVRGRQHDVVRAGRDRVQRHLLVAQRNRRVDVQQADVERAGVQPRQLLLDAVLAGDERDAVGALRAHERRDDPRPERAQVPEPDRPRLAGRDLPRRGDRGTQLPQRRAGAREQRLARGCERDRRAREQRHAELALEPRDLLAERGLGEVQPLRRAREVQLLADDHEGLQQPRVDAQSVSHRRAS